MRKPVALLAGAALVLGAGACGSSSSDDSAATGATNGAASGDAAITGAGSTFAAPIYQEFAAKLADEGVKLNYQGTGSGAGVESLIQGTVQFAGSDPPLEASEVSKVGDPVHLPVAFGAITIAYNLPGVDSGLKLDAATIAAIFSGRITNWNDASIAKLNPGVKLPDTSITTVHRSDESGTTKGFTGWLDAVDKQWADSIGSDKTVDWPGGTGAQGNDGVAAAVKQTDGGVGYVEQAYALRNDFTVADVENSSGRFVAPTLPSTSAAAEGGDIPKDLRFAITDPQSPRAYPIVSQTFLIMHKDLCGAGATPAQVRAIGKFVDYTLGPGQAEIEKLSYAKLPDSLDAKAKAAAGSLSCDGSPA